MLLLLLLTHKEDSSVALANTGLARLMGKHVGTRTARQGNGSIDTRCANAHFRLSETLLTWVRGKSGHIAV